MEVEKRFYPLPLSHVRLERREEGKSPVLVGMSPPYDAWSPIRGDMRERFSRDAFKDSGEDVIATVEHDNARIFGRLSAGTLRLEDREDGAWYSVELGGRSYELDLIESIDRGEVKGSSFEFRTVDDEWQKDSEGVWSRTVLKAIRLQVGPVARPFYDDSSVALRSLEGWREHESRGTLALRQMAQRLQAQRMTLDNFGASSLD